MDLGRRRGQHQAVGRRRRREGRGRRADGEALDHRPGGRVEGERLPPPIDQTSPPATMGEPLAPLASVHDAVGAPTPSDVTARTPLLHGTKRVPLRSAEPPSDEAQKSAVERHLAADTAQVGLVEHVGRLATCPTSKTSPFGQECRGRGPEVEVGGVVAVPGRRGERVEQLHGRAELEHAVALVVGVGRQVVGAVARGHPHVALGVDGGGRAAHPHRPLAVTGRTGHGVDGRGRAVLGSRDHQAVVVARSHRRSRRSR